MPSIGTPLWSSLSETASISTITSPLRSTRSLTVCTPLDLFDDDHDHDDHDHDGDDHDEDDGCKR